MKRTSIGVLAVLVLLSAGAGFGFDHMLTASGRATFVPSVFLPVLLLLLAIVVLALAWPVRRSVRGGTRIDPFRALRAATLGGRTRECYAWGATIHAPFDAEVVAAADQLA